LTFVPKLAVVLVVCLGLGSWMLSVAMELSTRLFELAGTL
jgi:flagellar biosynthetic protein FliQ